MQWKYCGLCGALVQLQAAHVELTCVQVGLSRYEEPGSTTYSSLLGKLMQQDTQPLMGIFAAIDQVIGDVSKYVRVWFQYQSLWDMDQGAIFSHLEEDLAKWQQLLHEIK